MIISELIGQTICIIGYGREGQAMLRAVQKYAPSADVTVADGNDQLGSERPELQAYSLQTGDNYLTNLDRFDIVIKSPGIPPQPEFDAISDRLTNTTQIFMDTVKAAGATVIGVTGSKGKSTIASLTAAILRHAGFNISLLGNIGEPAIAHLDEAEPGKYFVLEMSSYQLLQMTTSPQIAVVGSMFPEHLDYHGSMEDYVSAKERITRFQTESDIVFYDQTNTYSQRIAERSPGQVVPVTSEMALVRLDSTKLIGAHNQINLSLACAVAMYLDIENEPIIAACTSFDPLPHRLQSLGIHHNLEWIDDSISTTPETTIAALQALKTRTKILFLGGQDRGNNFTALASEIATSAVELVIVFPDSGRRIETALHEAGAPQTIVACDTMSSAIETARTYPIKHPTDGDTPIALLSPASPSYNQYKNFEERGDTFAAAITG